MGEEFNTWLDIVVEIEKAESHQNPPAVGISLCDCKLVEIESFNEEQVHRKPNTHLQLLFINHDGILCRDLVIHTNVRVWSMNPKEFSGDLVVII